MKLSAVRAARSPVRTDFSRRRRQDSRHPSRRRPRCPEKRRRFSRHFQRDPEDFRRDSEKRQRDWRKFQRDSQKRQCDSEKFQRDSQKRQRDSEKFRRDWEKRQRDSEDFQRFSEDFQRDSAPRPRGRDRAGRFSRTSPARPFFPPFYRPAPTGPRPGRRTGEKVRRERDGGPDNAEELRTACGGRWVGSPPRKTGVAVTCRLSSLWCRNNSVGSLLLKMWPSRKAFDVRVRDRLAPIMTDVFNFQDLRAFPVTPTTTRDIVQLVFAVGPGDDAAVRADVHERFTRVLSILGPFPETRSADVVALRARRRVPGDLRYRPHHPLMFIEAWWAGTAVAAMHERGAYSDWAATCSAYINRFDPADPLNINRDLPSPS
jgi:hypothetical protein